MGSKRGALRDGCLLAFLSCRRSTDARSGSGGLAAARTAQHARGAWRAVRGAAARVPRDRRTSMSDLNFGMVTGDVAHVTMGAGKRKKIFHISRHRGAMAGAGWSTIESDPGVFTVGPEAALGCAGAARAAARVCRGRGMRTLPDP